MAKKIFDRDVLMDLATSKKIVRALDKALKDNTLMSWCPFGARAGEDICDNVCYSIWTDLDNGMCSCNKSNRKEVAELIVNTAKAIGTYDPDTDSKDGLKVGDIFKSKEKGHLMIVAAWGNGRILTGLGAAKQSTLNRSGQPVPKDQVITIGDFTKNPSKYTYIGNINDMTDQDGDALLDYIKTYND